MKGTGKCGFYRVPGESTAEEDKPKPKTKKAVSTVNVIHSLYDTLLI